MVALQLHPPLPTLKLGQGCTPVMVRNALSNLTLRNALHSVHMQGRPQDTVTPTGCEGVAHLQLVTEPLRTGAARGAGAGCLSRFHVITASPDPDLLYQGWIHISVSSALTQTDICTLSGLSLCCELHCAASLVRPRALCLSPGRGGRQSQISRFVHCHHRHTHTLIQAATGRRQTRLSRAVSNSEQHNR